MQIANIARITPDRLSDNKSPTNEKRQQRTIRGDVVQLLTVAKRFLGSQAAEATMQRLLTQDSKRHKKRTIRDNIMTHTVVSLHGNPLFSTQSPSK
jgi:hypothetical protein